jgi:hypothetical protein
MPPCIAEVDEAALPCIVEEDAVGRDVAVIGAVRVQVEKSARETE